MFLKAVLAHLPLPPLPVWEALVAGEQEAERE